MRLPTRRRGAAGPADGAALLGVNIVSARAYHPYWPPGGDDPPLVELPVSPAG